MWGMPPHPDFLGDVRARPLGQHDGIERGRAELRMLREDGSLLHGRRRRWCMRARRSSVPCRRVPCRKWQACRAQGNPCSRHLQVVINPKGGGPCNYSSNSFSTLSSPPRETPGPRL